MQNSARPCLVCGGPLGYRKKRFCSPECKLAEEAQRARENRARKRRSPEPCKECKGAVEDVGVGRPPEFCSNICKLRFHSRRRRRRLLPVAADLPSKLCANCGQEFSPERSNAVYCSQRCYRRGNAKRPKFEAEQRRCANCGETFTTRRHDQRFCCLLCQRRHHNRRTQRSQVRPSSPDQYSDIDIFERDKWRCHLCGKFVRRNVPRTDPDGAVIDHLVPLAIGGQDVASNVATAHRKCNEAKGVRPSGEQLRIV